MLAVPVVLGLSMMLVACDDDDQDAAAAGTAEQQTQVETSVDAGQTDDADQARTSQEPVVTDVDPEKFEFRGGAYAFLLEDDLTACVISDESSPLSGVGCFVELDDPPLSPGNNAPVSLFEMTPEGDAGLTTDLHPIDREGMKTLEDGHRIEAHGITCTALGGSDFSCEANGTKVVFEDGETPDVPVIQGGAGAIGRAAASGSGSGGSSTTKIAGEICGQVTMSNGGRSTMNVEVRKGSVDCDEVLPIVEQYIETSSDGEHGMENWRSYADWTCKNPRELRGGKPQYLVSCSTDDGDHVAIANPDWRP